MSAPGASGTLGRRLAIVASVVVLATVVTAVVVTGSPSARRDAKLDERRVRDLVAVVEAIDEYVKTEAALPPRLDTLASRPGVRLAIVDPSTGEPYEFEATGPRAYRLCARFVTDTAQTPPDNGYPPHSVRWAHGIGRQCFERVVGSETASQR